MTHSPSAANDKNHIDEIPDEILEQAATWLVILQDMPVDADTLEQFNQWKNKDTRHTVAIKNMEKMMGIFHQTQYPDKMLPRQVLQDLELELDQYSQRKQTQSVYPYFFIVLTCTLLISVISWQYLPTDYWFADTKTSYSEWQKQQLSDKSEIKISGKTAYNLKFNQKQRVVELLEGNILVDVAKDAKRPFIVKTPYAQITALGTRFIVNQNKQRTTLTMLHSATELKSENGRIWRINTGQQISIDTNGNVSQHSIQPDLQHNAWQQHALVVDNMPLDQVLDTLQSYQTAQLRYNADKLKHIQVSAILPLDASALKLLQQSLNLQIEKQWFNRVKITVPETNP